MAEMGSRAETASRNRPDGLEKKVGGHIITHEFSLPRSKGWQNRRLGHANRATFSFTATTRSPSIRTSLLYPFAATRLDR